MVVSTIRAPLFVPADRPDRFSKAAISGADAIILDLEDAIAHSEKDEARSHLDSRFTELPIIVRVNAVGTPWFNDDIRAVAQLGFRSIMLPKVESVNQVAHTFHSFSRRVKIYTLIESPVGLSVVRDVAKCEGVAQLCFGSLDYCAELGCAHHRDILVPVRSEIVMASYLAGLPRPLDGVTVDICDIGKLREDTQHARDHGMGGKLCIHPSQIAEVAKTFSPTQDEVAWANKVLDATDGVAVVGGEMVDEPVRKRALSILNAIRTEA